MKSKEDKFRNKMVSIKAGQGLVSKAECGSVIKLKWTIINKSKKPWPRSLLVKNYTQ